MKVNQDQIENLYQFTRAHFVEWYDVQTELVDHLANGIEAQWEGNPNLTFKECLNNEFKEFGIFGFSEVVEQKTNALSKYYIKEVFKHLKEYFKLPKVILTLSSVWILFKIMQVFENKDYFVIPVVLLVFSFVIIYAIKESIRLKKSYKATGKKWLFESITGQFGGFIHFLNIKELLPKMNRFLYVLVIILFLNVRPYIDQHTINSQFYICTHDITLLYI